MLKFAPVVLALALGSVFTIGCSAQASDAGDSESAMTESDLSSSDLVGAYIFQSELLHNDCDDRVARTSRVFQA